jgi:hypothetical protein
MKISLLKIILLILLFPLTISPFCFAMQNEKQFNSENLWRLVAQSDLILEGQLMVPHDKIKQYLSDSSTGYVDLNLLIHNVYKGEGNNNQSIQISYYVEESKYNPSPEALMKMDQKNVIVVLTTGDSGNKKLYFAGNTPLALRPSDNAEIALFQNEIALQKRIVDEFPQHFQPSQIVLYDEVRILIQDLTINADIQEENFKKLESLGEKAVPAIILLMDDRRPLPAKSISLENKWGNNFEAFRHYGPECVVDGLSAVLNQITGESFSFIYNGGSESARKHTVDGWKIYLYYLGVNPGQFSHFFL